MKKSDRRVFIYSFIQRGARMEERTYEKIVVKTFEKIGDAINLIRNKDGGVIDISEVTSQEERQRITHFMEGGLYALEANVDVDAGGDRYSIKINYEMIYQFVESYYGKNSNSIEISLAPESNIRKLVDLFKEGRALTVDFSLLLEEKAREYFGFLCGAVFALRGNAKKVENNVFLFTPAIKVIPNVLAALIRGNVRKIKKLREAAVGTPEIRQIKGLFERNIQLYDNNKILSDDRLSYAEFLEKKELYIDAIKHVEEACAIHIAYGLKTFGLFKRCLIKAMELHCRCNGIDNAEAFAYRLIEQCSDCVDVDFKNKAIVMIYNEIISLHLQNKESRKGLKAANRLRKSKVNLDNYSDFTISQFYFYIARSLFNLGHFVKARSIIRRYLPETSPYHIEGQRLMAAAYSKQGSRKEKDAYENLVKRFINDSNKHSNFAYDCACLANYYSEAKRGKGQAFMRALELYQLAVDNCPSESKAELAAYYNNMGACYIEQYKIDPENQLELAKKAFMKAIDIYMSLSDNPFYDYSSEIIREEEFLTEIKELEKEKKTVKK